MKRRIFFNGTTDVVRRPQDEGVSARERRMSTAIKGGSLAAMAALISGVAILGVNGQAQGLTYQTTINPEFTINPAISVSLSSADLVINDLEPGTTKDSNIITVTVSTNNASGYTLGSTVGNSTTYNYDALKNNVDNTKSFTNLTSAGSLTAGKWGYSYSNDNGTNWSTYNGLPLYTSTPVEIASSSSASTTNTQFKIGAYATTGQAAGEYNNVVNFIATASPEPEPTLADVTYMQDTFSCENTPTGTSNTLIDTRDNEQYLVKKLDDGKCWMLDNLRLDPTAVDLATLKGNTNASDTTLTYLKNGGGSSPYTGTAVSTTWSNSYNTPIVVTTYKDNTTTSYGSGSGKVGVYYNYCAASAGSYCYAVFASSGNASEDLCPANWRMPTGSSDGEYQALYTAYSSNAINFRNALSTPLSGYFYDSSQGNLGSSGWFWSSTYSTGQHMYILSVSSSVGLTGYSYRHFGLSMRCVLSQ